MDLGAILLLIGLLAGVTLYLAAPLMRNQSRTSLEETQEVSSLLAERDRILNALQELDFDFKLGKIPAEDYPVQRADLLRVGSAVLKKLDELSSSADDRTRQRKKPDKTEGLTDEEIETMLAARRKARKTKSAGFCPRCGKAVLATDLFCPNCGKALR